MKCLYEKNIWHISNDDLKLFKNCTTRSKEIDAKMKSSLEEFEKKCAGNYNLFALACILRIYI